MNDLWAYENFDAQLCQILSFLTFDCSKYPFFFRWSQLDRLKGAYTIPFMIAQFVHTS